MRTSVRPIWGESADLCRHLFQMVQTKSLYLPANVFPALVCTIANTDELRHVLWLLSKLIDGTNQVRICLLYCSYDPWFEFCKSRNDPAQIERHNKAIEYAARDYLWKYPWLNISFASEFLKTQPLTNDFLALPDMYSQRNMILKGMVSSHSSISPNPSNPLEITKTSENKNVQVLGHLGFHWSSFYQVEPPFFTSATTAVPGPTCLFDTILDKDQFVTCVLIIGVLNRQDLAELPSFAACPC